MGDGTGRVKSPWHKQHLDPHAHPVTPNNWVPTTRYTEVWRSGGYITGLGTPHCSSTNHLPRSFATLSPPPAATFSPSMSSLPSGSAQTVAPTSVAANHRRKIKAAAQSITVSAPNPYSTSNTSTRLMCSAPNCSSPRGFADKASLKAHTKRTQ